MNLNEKSIFADFGLEEESKITCYSQGETIIRLFLILSFLLLAACGVASQRLTQDKAKQKIQELAFIQLKGNPVQVENISQSRDNQAIAEANLRLAFKLSKTSGGDWQIDAIRLGDRNWIDVRAFLSALDEVRARETRENLQKLFEGLRKFKEKAGKYPQAEDIVKLTDILVPDYMSEVIRYDGWNRELIFNSMTPDSFQLFSLGADGIRGTADDIILSP